MELVDLYQSRASVFTRSELAQIYPTLSEKQLTNALFYAVKNGKLRRVRRGFYTKPSYDLRELACKLYSPAYVSLDTVLFEKGVIFQPASETFCISRVSREVKVGEVRLRYRKIKDLVLTNVQGIERDGVKSIASLERAVLDTLLLDGERYLDNLRPIDWTRINQLLPIYHNKALAKRVKELENDATN